MNNSYEYRGNKRPKEHGLLVSIRKDILSFCKKEDMEKDSFAHTIGLASWGSLENKLKRTKDDTDITITELLHIQELTKSHAPLKYMCEMFGFVMTSTETDEETTVEELNSLSDKAQMESNESWAEIKKASADGKFTVEEKEAMKKEAMEALEAKQKELKAIEKIVPVDIEEYEE